MVDLLKKMNNKRGSQKIVISIVVIVLFIAAVTVGTLLYSNSVKKNESTETEVNALERDQNNIENKDKKDSTSDEITNNTNTEENSENNENDTLDNDNNNQNAAINNTNNNNVINNTQANNVNNNVENNNNEQAEETYFQKVVEEEVVNKEWEKANISWEPLAVNAAIIPADTTTRKPVIELTKESSIKDGSVTTGNKITYTIKAKNIGNVEAKNLTISDEINTEFFKIDNIEIKNDGKISEDGIVTWNIEKLAADEEIFVEFTVETKEIADEKVKTQDKVEITNIAKITGENIKDVKSEEVKNDYEKEIITKEKEAFVIRDEKEIRITSLDNTSVVQGETIKYKITLKNEGTLSKAVKIEDILPTQLEDVKIINYSNGTVDNNFDRIVWNVEVQKRDDEKNPGEVTLEYTAKVKNDATGDIKNSVITDGGDPESTVTTPIVTAEKSSTVVLPTNILTGTSKKVTTGTILRYDITVTNTSKDTDAKDVVITDTIPEGTTLLKNNQYQISDDGNILNDQKTISWNIDVEKDAKRTVSFYVTVNENENNTTIKNIAKVNGKDVETSDTYIKPIITGTKKAYVTRDGSDVEITPDSNISVVRGETIKYKVTLKNDGSLSKSVIVKDKLPIQLQDIIPLSGYNGNVTNQDSILTWTVEVPAKSGEISGEQVLEYTAKVTDTASGIISNSIIIDNGDPESTIKTPVIISNKSTTIVDNEGNKSNKDYVTTGDRIKYTINVENTSNVEAKNVIVRDVIPEGTHLVEGTISDDGSLENNTIKWIFDSITGTKTLTFIVEVDENEQISTTIENTAYVNGIETNKVVTPYERPNFVVEKQADKKVAKIGEDITYTLTIKNTGKCEGTESVTDTLPLDSLEIVDANGAIQDGNKLSWSVSLNGESSTTITYKVKVKENATLITNKVEITNGSTDEEKTPVIVPTKKADVTSVKPNGTVKYTITVENKSSIDATGIDVRDDVRNGTTFDKFVVEDGSKDGGEFVESEDERYVIWKNQTIEAGKTNTYTFTVKVNSDVKLGDKIENVAVVDKTPTDPVVTTVEEAKISAEKTADKQEATKGDIITYTITLKNDGNKAGKVSMEDSIPVGTTYVDGSVKLDGNNEESLTCVDNQKIVLSEINVEKGSSKVVTFQVTVNGDVKAVIKNKALYITEDGETPTNEVVTAIVEKSVKDEDGKDINEGNVKENDILKYEITINNTENNSARIVNISDELPNSVTLLNDATYSISDNGTKNGTTLSWNNIEVPANTTKTVSFYVKVNDINNNDEINNTASVNGNNTNTVKNNYLEPIIQVSKSSSVGEGNKVNRGNEITYTLIAENKGGLEKENVVITDKIPEGTTFVSADDSLVPEEINNEDGSKDLVLTWKVNVPEYTKVEKHFTVKVDEKTELDSIKNTAKIDEKDTNTTEDKIHYDDKAVRFSKKTDTVIGKNIVMVLDVSYSMNEAALLENNQKEIDYNAPCNNWICNEYYDHVWENGTKYHYKTKLQAAKQVMISYLENIFNSNPEMTVDIIAFAGEIKNIDRVNKSNYVNIINSYNAASATNIYDALEKTKDIVKKYNNGNDNMVIFLGDGEPTRGKYTSAEKLGKYAKTIYNTKNSDTKIYSIGFSVSKNSEADKVLSAIDSSGVANLSQSTSELINAFNEINKKASYVNVDKLSSDGKILNYKPMTQSGILINQVDGTKEIIIKYNDAEYKFSATGQKNSIQVLNETSSTVLNDIGVVITYSEERNEFNVNFRNSTIDSSLENPTLQIIYY